MSEQIIKNNVVEVLGKVTTEFKFSHEVYGEGFYSFKIEVPRLSDMIDIIPIIISERLINVHDSIKGKYVEVAGQFRSYNKHDEEGKSKLILSVFARDIKLIDDLSNKNPNSINLNGFICKKPIYRTTPFGREITDLLIAVNRPYNKSDYVPAIAWGRNARYAEKLKVGTHIKIWGRIQSRKYQKRISETEYVSKLAYEVSISKMEIIEDENDKNDDNNIE